MSLFPKHYKIQVFTVYVFFLFYNFFDHCSRILPNHDNLGGNVCHAVILGPAHLSSE